jgi:hypothetical protein
MAIFQAACKHASEKEIVFEIAQHVSPVLEIAGAWLRAKRDAILAEYPDLRDEAEDGPHAVRGSDHRAVDR